MRVNLLDRAPAHWEAAMTLEFERPLVAHIDEAIAMEGSVLRLLDSAILGIDDAEAKEALRHHKAETERHIDRLRARLLAHGGTSSFVREAGGMIGAVMKSLLDLARSERAAREARDVYAAEHLEIAAYRLLERIAIWAGDEDTAAVARENLADEEQMVAWFDDHWNCLAEVALAERLTHA
jgi:ferritin-like metal-binding protein YciE